MARDTQEFDVGAALERLFSASADMQCVAEVQGAMRRVNAAWTRATGWALDALTSRPFLDFIHPDDRAALLAYADPGVGETDARDAARFTARFRGADGGYRLLEWRAIPAAQEGLLCATVRDVTEERRRVAHAVQIESITGVGSWELDPDTSAVFWSPAVYRIHELDPSRHHPTVETAFAFYPPEARAKLEPAIQRLMRDGTPCDMELPLDTAKGRRIWVRVTAAVERRGGGVLRAFGTVADITEMRARRRHEQRLSAVARTITRAAVICDVAGRIEWTNPAFTRLTGLAPTAVAGACALTLLRAQGGDPADVARIVEALEAGRGVACDLVARDARGRERWFAIDVQPVTDPDGAPCGHVALLGDITARRLRAARLRRAEAQARAAQSRLLAAIEALPDGFALYDADDRLVVCNARYRSFYAESAEAMVPGATFETILRHGLRHGQYLDALGREEAWLAERLAAHRDTNGAVEQHLNDGRWLRVIEHATPDGGRVGLRIDITDLKRERRRLADVIEGARVGTWEWNLQSGARVYNDHWAEMLGYRLAELEADDALSFERLAHADDLSAARTLLERHLRGEIDHFECEIRLRHKDGGWRWILDRGRLVQRDASGAPLLMSGTHQDITARKADEAALAEALRKAEQASVAKSQFLANMSHEIRTPMNGVLGMAEVLARSLSDPGQQRMLAVIRESGEVLLNIINDILDFSKIEAGRLDLETVDFTPSDLARRVESLHTLKASEKGVSLVVLTSRGAELARRGDPHRILQILHNLVSNAIKFTAEGEVTVKLRCAPTGPMVIDVIDTGIGMTPEQTARIFEDFAQADNSITRTYGGTGLGMAIVRRLVEAMQGEIAVDSEPGEGTCVRVTLPLPLVEAGAQPQETTPPHAVALAPGLRVLAADDNEINRMVLNAMLSAMEARTVMVDGGRAAVEAFAPGAFDALLLDISMPDMDGVAALAAIREREASAGCAPTPALAVTANALTHQIAHYLGCGFDGHVAKPIRPEALREAVMRCANRPLGETVRARA